MGNSKHKAKKKKRHERQIEEGVRVERVKVKEERPIQRGIPVRLSSLDPVKVRKILDAVAKLDLSK